MAHSIGRAGCLERAPPASIRSMISAPTAPVASSHERPVKRLLTRNAASVTQLLPAKAADAFGAMRSWSRGSRCGDLLAIRRQRSAAEPPRPALPGDWAGGLPENPVPGEGARVAPRSRRTLAYAGDLKSVPVGPTLGMNVPRGTKMRAAGECARGSMAATGWLGFTQCSTWNMAAEPHRAIALSRDPGVRVSGSRCPPHECNPQ